MQQVKMVSTSDRVAQVRGHRLARGEEFTIEEPFAQIFERQGWAKRKQDEPQDPGKQEYQTRDMAAQGRKGRRRAK